MLIQPGILVSAAGSDAKSGLIYSYFEIGCRIKCTRQPRSKVIWVVLSSPFFKEIWKNGTRDHGRYVCECWRKATKVGSIATVSGTVYWSYPILPFGIVVCTFFLTTFLEIAACNMLLTVISSIWKPWSEHRSTSCLSRWLHVDDKRKAPRN